MDRGVEFIQVIKDLLNCVNHGGIIHVAQMVYDITNSYGESFRHYHTLEHIADCFEEYEEVKKHFRKPIFVKFALLYHDIVYIPGYDGNERASAARAALDAYKLGLGEEQRKYIMDCIEATARPAGSILMCSKDHEYVHDIDYSILGQDKETFIQYENAIHNEFSISYDDDKYRHGRLMFLNKLLNLNSIYFTDHFCKKYEKKAKENIRYAINVLNRGK
jgi:predicted metal-dependent HD superfamily phosphohydrolase